MDKNRFFISPLIWAVEVFRSLVPNDFNLMDGVSVCAYLCFSNNPENFIRSLIDCSKEHLLNMWPLRHSKPGGALGLLFELAVSRNGGVARGDCGTRRYQPMVGQTLPPNRYVGLIQHAYTVCKQSQRHKKQCTEQKQYDAIIDEFQKHMTTQRNPRKDPRMGLQHYVHALHGLRFYMVEGLHNFASINMNNSNKKKFEQYFGPDPPSVSKKEKVVIQNKKRAKIQTIKTQIKLFLNEVFETDEVSDSVVENMTCELLRVLKANDLVFPGQQFILYVGNRQVRVELRWDKQSNLFKEKVVSSFDAAVTSINDMGSGRLIAGDLNCRCPCGDLYCRCIIVETRKFIPRENIDETTMRKIKQLFCRPDKTSESYADYYARVCSQLDGLLARMNTKKRKISNSDALARTGILNWNDRRSNLLQSVLTDMAPIFFNPLKKQKGKNKAKKNPKNVAVETTMVTDAPDLPYELSEVPPVAGLPPPETTTTNNHLDDSLLAEALYDEFILCDDDMSEELNFAGDDLSFDTHPLLLSSRPTSPAPVVLQPKKRKNRWDDSSGGLPKKKVSRWQPQPPPGTDSDTDSGTDTDPDIQTPSFIPEVTILATPTTTPKQVERTRPPVERTRPPGSIGFGLTMTRPKIRPTPTTMPTPTKRRINALSLVNDPGRPQFVDSDGYTKKVDWTGSLHKQAEKKEWPKLGTLALYKDAHSLDSILGTTYKGFVGSRSVFEHKTVTYHELPSLLDEATNAINSGRNGKEPLPPFTKDRFGYQRYTEDQQLLYQCTLQEANEEVEFFKCGNCLLCDQIAPLLLGRKTMRNQDATYYEWWFESAELSRTFLLLCLILTGGDTAYFLDIHKRARRRFCRATSTAQDVTRTNYGKSSLECLERSDFFVVGFGERPKMGVMSAKEKSKHEIPFFYVIGKTLQGKPKHQVDKPMISNDFCVVVPDLGFHRKYYRADGSRKPGLGKATSANVGKAAYIRPVIGL